MEDNKKAKCGLICGAFDVIHPGYIRMFREAKQHCGKLIIALQDDPTIDRPEKDRPVQTWEERREVLEAIRYVDGVKKYSTEAELYELLKERFYDTRVLGTDYKDKHYTGKELGRDVLWHERNHSYSASGFKRKIAKSIQAKKCKNCSC